MSGTFFSALPNPKQNGINIVGRHTWYSYYAGYSPTFVQKVLEDANLGPTAVVCDPWNGSGTTTQIAHDTGYLTVGFDLNPAMVVVARSRLVMPSQGSALRRNLEGILRHARSYDAKEVLQSDPLNLWLKPCAALVVRHIERAIWAEFRNGAENSQNNFQPWNVSNEIALFYTAVFRCLSRLSKRFRTSNPTWIKVPQNSDDCLCFTIADFVRLFETEASQMLSSLAEEPPILKRVNQIAKVRIEVASSDALPIKSGDVDIVISSPPYCTRIDYAVSTSLELAFLGFDYYTSVRSLRDRMIGTSTVRDPLPEEDPRWGPTCNRFLSQIRNHSSKASRSYYLKTHLQYFHAIFRSLSELNRVLRRRGDCLLVVQDSYYKDIHNDLASIVTEMASSVRWEVVGRQNFPVRLIMARVNRHSRRYRSSAKAAESVLWFKTSES